MSCADRPEAVEEADSRVERSVVLSPQVRLGRAVLSVVLVLALGTVLRLVIVGQQGLWADEVFSLAIATGHSLEHPAARADASLGDYVETAQPRGAREYVQYLRHDRPVARPSRIIRALLLSDASPPLYYLLLWVWTQVAGTSDAALRLLSLAWTLACFPVLLAVARTIGGRPAMLPAAVLFAVSPLSLYYSTEGRMYSLVWFFALSLAWLTMTLRERRARPVHVGLWVLTGAAGMLTHYFFSFILAAFLSWLLLRPGRFGRGVAWLGALAITVLVLPWYVNVPESLTAWRITQSWLLVPSGSRLLGLLRLPASFVATSGPWGWHVLGDTLVLTVCLVLAVLAGMKLGRRVLSVRRQLVWLWAAAACAAPIALDLLKGTYASLIVRYASAGLPAALLLLALGFSRIRPWLRISLLALLVVAWAPGAWTVITHPSRKESQPYRELATLVDGQTSPSDLVIVHSIPSGILGVARYLQKPTDLFSWVGQLGQRRVPEDLRRVVPGRRRIVLVKVHAVGEPAPEEAWLRENAMLEWESRLGEAEVLSFRPRRGEALFPDG